MVGDAKTLREKLRKLYVGARCQVKQGNADGRDLNEYWNQPAQQEIHLPLSLELLEKTFEPADLTYGREKQENDQDSNNSESGERVLLLMAGFSIEQLALCITLHYRHSKAVSKPLKQIIPFFGEFPDNKTPWIDEIWSPSSDRIGLRETLDHFVSRQSDLVSGEEIDEIMNFVGPAEHVDSGNPAKVFQALLNWWKKDENQSKSIAIDVTGGQKPMDSGGTYAAMYLGVPAYYLDFTQYDPEFRRPYPHSLQYAELALPSVVFSHDQRKAIVQHFETKSFSKARLITEPLLKEVRENDEFFGLDDEEDIEKADQLIEKCSAWIAADYCHPSLRDSPLHQPFCSFEKKGIREMVYRLQQESQLLLSYLADEYVRLKTLLDSSLQSSQTENSTSALREYFVGSAGFCELIVDSIFHIQRFTPCVAEVKSVRGSVLALESKKNGGKENQENVTNQIRTEMANKRLPVRRLPPCFMKKKVDLLFGKSQTFDVWEDAIESCPVADGPKHRPFLVHDFRESHNADSFLKQTDDRLIIKVKLKLETALMDSSLEENWKESWGNFGCDSAWIDLRNIYAHMRAPISSGTLSVANSIDSYLLRFVGLYAIASTADSEAVTNDGALDRGKQAIDSASSVPWTVTINGKTETRSQELRDLLRLP